MFVSRGRVTLVGWIKVQIDGVERKSEMNIEVDLVGACIPLLASRRSLQRMGDSLNFEKNVMELPNNRALQFIELRSGHLSFEWEPKGSTSGLAHHSQQPVYVCNEQIPTAEPPVELKIIDEATFWKIHHHLAHCSLATIERLGKTAGYQMDSAKGKQRIEKCPCKKG